MKAYKTKLRFLRAAFLAVSLGLCGNAGAVTETFDGETGGTLLTSLGGGGVWWTGGSHAVVAGGGVAGSNGIGTETSSSFIFNWQSQPFQWSAMAVGDKVTIGLDFQTSPTGTFDDDRVGWTIDAASNTSSANQFAIQLDNTSGGGMECYWESNRTVLDALSGIKSSTWYRLRVEYTKLTDTSAAITATLTELDASGDPTGTPYVGTIADTSAAPYSVPAGRFTSTYQWPTFKNYMNAAGNADNAYFSLGEETGPEHVVVISVDGMGSAYVSPLLASGLANELVNIKRLMNEGAGTLNARCDYNYAVTLPNHVTMMTSRGVLGVDGHGWTSNTDPGAATLESNKGSYVDSGFGIAHDAGLRTGIWSGKSKFSLFQQSYSATTGASDTNGVDNGKDKIDYDLISNGISAANITINFTNQMTAAPCHFAFVHYQDPDATGHSSGWSTDPTSAFATTLKAVDNAIGVILQMIEASPVLAGKTAIVITADHGGHGTTHGDTTNPLDFTVPFYVWGPGVTAGADLYALNPASRQAPGATVHPPYTGPQPVRDGDAANTALYLLGLQSIPGSTINAAHDLVLSGVAAALPPEVAITEPANGATKASPVTVDATATDADGAVTNVSFFAGATWIGDDATSPFGVVWTDAPNGSYALTAVAYDGDGLCTTSSVVNITVAEASSGGFTAYNDCSSSSGTPANTTEYRGNGTTSGFLKDFDTGAVLPVTLTITANQVAYDGGGGPMPNSGTDAYDVFNGKVVFDDVIWYNNVTTWWMEATFTGLDPEKEYVFVTSANRGRSDGDYGQRFSKFTISGADSCVQAGTTGVTVHSNESVTFSTGNNSVNGYVARWTNIKCGADGTFKVRVEDGGGVQKGYAFDGIMLQETGGEPPWNGPPSVAITSPAPSATVRADLTIEATATDDGTVTNVAFFADGTLLGHAPSSPYAWNWTGAPLGPHALFAVAWDDEGLCSTSATVNVTVAAPQPPVVSITSPANGATVGTSFAINASASDSDGAVAGVAFYGDGALLGSDSSSPYSHAWSGAGAGSHALIAVATDDEGLVATSAVVTVTSVASTGFTAYNDCSSSAGTPANTTQYRGNGTTSGFLKDFETGATLPVAIALAGQYISYDIAGGGLTAGTDCYDVFNGKVPFDDCVAYSSGQPAWWMTATFTGLDPAKEYEFVTAGNRNTSTYTGRFTKFTISGVDACVEASTPGVDVLSNESVRFCTGYNTLNGYVARWTKIRCGADGTFTVRAEDGAGAEANKSYAFDGIMLRESAIAEPPALTGITRDGSSVGLSWSGAAGPVRVEESPSLSNPSWTTVEGATNLQGGAYSIDLDGEAPQRFYRLVVE